MKPLDLPPDSPDHLHAELNRPAEYRPAEERKPRDAYLVNAATPGHDELREPDHTLEAAPPPPAEPLPPGTGFVGQQMPYQHQYRPNSSYYFTPPTPLLTAEPDAEPGSASISNPSDDERREHDQGAVLDTPITPTTGEMRLSQS